MTKKTQIIYEFNENNGRISYSSSILTAIEDAQLEIDQLNETIGSLQSLKPQCDKLDYVLSASLGALCGIIDVFLVGVPSNSALMKVTDKWFGDCTKAFAKACGWKPRRNTDMTNSAIGFLERKFKVPYDQTSIGEAAKQVLFTNSNGHELLNTKNHHFLSLGHNPNLLGLFFSILNQFTDSSTFIVGGNLIELQEADGKFELKGNSLPSKIFCGFVNWIGHLMSDISGSSGNSGRGTGIPSPLWTWINDIIVVKSKLGKDISKFDKDLQNLAIEIYKNGYDVRFQAAQAIPVFVNSLLVRLIYAIRRSMSYYQNTPISERSFRDMWSICKPFNNLTIDRMMTVAHGIFVVVDVGDATIRGFATTGFTAFNPVEFFLRLNLIGLGRFTICLYNEGQHAWQYHKTYKEAEYASKMKVIVEDYLRGLLILHEVYNEESYLTLIEDLHTGDYERAFGNSTKIAKHRGVSKPLTTKEDIDNYFNK